MLSLAFALLVASPSPDAKPDKTAVLVLDLDIATGVAKGEAAILDEIVANAVGAHPELSSVSAAELQRMVALEGQKQVMGCDTTSCLGELAGAMGARYVVSGRVGVLGGLTVVSLNLFDSAAAKVVARQEARAASLDAAARLLNVRVEALLAGIEGIKPIDVVAERSDDGGIGLPVLAGGGAALVGVVGLASGGVWLGLAMGDLGNAATTRAQKDGAVGAVPIAPSVATVGAVALVGGGIVALLGLSGGGEP
jgi:hypothetical protein